MSAFCVPFADVGDAIRIHKAKYNDNEKPSHENVERGRGKGASTPEKEKKPRDKSRTRTIFGRKKSVSQPRP